MATWSVWSYDVWGNKRDGYEVNNRSRICRIEGPVDPSDKQALRMAKVGGLLKPSVRLKSLVLDGDEGYITFTARRDGCPLGELVEENP
jgi:hypothetical protein